MYKITTKKMVFRWFATQEEANKEIEEHLNHISQQHKNWTLIQVVQYGFYWQFIWKID